MRRERERGIEDVRGDGIVIIGKLHEVAEKCGEFGVRGFAEVFLKSAPGLAGLEGSPGRVGPFGELSAVGEGEFTDPDLEQEGRDVEGRPFLGVKFSSVLKGVHDRERARRHGIDYLRRHRIFDF